MQIEIDVTCMHTNFGGRGLFGFGVMASFCLPSKIAKISLWTMGYSPLSSKNLIDRNRLKKFMQIGIDATCMRTNCGGCGLSVSELWLLFACLQKWPKFPFGPWTIVHGHQKIYSIGIGSKNLCKQGLMSHACTLILVGMVSLVSELWLLFACHQKQPNFPFGPWAIQSIVIKKFN